MTDRPIATFPTLDEAESALDWIGLDFHDADGAFEGELEGDDAELLAATADDADAPAPVRELAAALLVRWQARTDEAVAFRVAWAG